MRRTVSSSLSFVLVTHNNETKLTADILDLLDIAVDLSSYIEVLIIDDGSTDETLSVAWDLARRFPQVYVHHNAMRYGNAAAMQTAMRETIGEYVFFCTKMPHVSHLQKLWGIRKSPRFVMGQPSEDKDLRLIHRPSVKSQADVRVDAPQHRIPEADEMSEKVKAPKHMSRASEHGSPR